jgi:hypothetical protein
MPEPKDPRITLFSFFRLNFTAKCEEVLAATSREEQNTDK